MIERFLECVREKKPLVHCITNYVTINDVANVILASGGRPVMAENPKEAKEIVSAAQALYINLGMLSDSKLEAMLIAGKQANALNIPIVLDPVGVGASHYRREAAGRLLSEVHFTVIRGNVSEIKALAKISVAQKGVDLNETDRISNNNLEENISFIKKFSKETNCIISISGPIDLISNGQECFCIYNGRKEMGDITGTGCQMSGIVGAMIGANEDYFHAVVCANVLMGLAGEIAYDHLQAFEGNSTYRNLIIDTIYRMDSDTFRKGEKYEIR